MCNSKRVAAIGYCFGGTCVLELARSGADVAGEYRASKLLATRTWAGPLSTVGSHLGGTVALKIARQRRQRRRRDGSTRLRALCEGANPALPIRSTIP